MSTSHDAKLQETLGKVDPAQLDQHYKDSYQLHRRTRLYRDLLFFFVLALLGVPSILAGGLAWALLFGATLRYYLLNIQVERERKYLTLIEIGLSSQGQLSYDFIREGGRSELPIGIMLWARRVYEWGVPLLVSSITLIHLWDRFHAGYTSALPSLVFFLMITASTALYLMHLTNRQLAPLIEEASNVLVKS